MKSLLVLVLLSVVHVEESVQKPTELLKMAVYYESLCEDCIDFITEELYPAYEKIGSYLSIDFVPYGNTKRIKKDDHWTYECQHGPKECLINMIQACGLALINDQDDQMEIVNCAAEYSNNLQDIKGCLNGLDLDISGQELVSCGFSALGLQFYGELAEKQEKLDPPSDHAPWIVFNDKYNATLEKEAVEDFFETACELLDNKPKACYC